MADKNLQFKIFASVVGAQSIDSLRKSVLDVQGAASGMNQTFGKVSTGVKALAAAFTTGVVATFTKSLIDTGDELFTLSQKTGITVRDLSAFKLAASTADLPLDGLTTAVKKLSINMVDAANGSKSARDAFKSAGVAFQDSKGIRSSSDVIRDLADRFSKFKDGPEKAALAVKLFGRAGTDLIPFLNQGREALSDFSSALSDDFAARADQFNDSLSVIGARLKSGFINQLDSFLPTIQQILDAFQSLPTIGSNAIGFFDAIGEGVRLLSVGIFTTIQTISGLADAFSTQYQRIKSLINLEDGAVRDSLQKGLEARQAQRIKSVADFTSKLTKDSLLFGDGSAEDIIKRQRSATKPLISSAASEVAGTKDSSGDASKAVDTAEKFRQSQLSAIALEKEKIKLASESEEVQKKAIATEEVAAQVRERSIGQLPAVQEQYKKIGEEILNAKLELIEYEKQQKESFSVGAKTALNDYLDKAKDVASQSKELFTRAFANIEDSLVDFVKTGKLNFSKFAEDIISDLIRIQVRALAVQSVTGIAGFFSPAAGAGGASVAGGGQSFVLSPNALGGIMTSNGPMSLQKYSRGGIANSPQLALFGEGRTPEAYVPLPDGRNIPVKLEGGAGGSNSVNVTVIMQSGGESKQTSESRGGSNLQAIGELIANKTREILVQEKRPGGLLA